MQRQINLILCVVCLETGVSWIVRCVVPGIILIKAVSQIPQHRHTHRMHKVIRMLYLIQLHFCVYICHRQDTHLSFPLSHRLSISHRTCKYHLRTAVVTSACEFFKFHCGRFAPVWSCSRCRLWFALIIFCVSTMSMLVGFTGVVNV